MLAATRPQADILEVISNLSSDEVFTPPPVANAVLDLLPDEVWSDPDLRWLDPGTKTGVFLREAARRLMDGLSEAIPNEDERREHILKDMLYGVAITELTSLMSRRSLYCSKDATSDKSLVQLDTPEGNIFFGRAEHDFAKSGRCKECGGSKEQIERGNERENYAYAFIHEDGRNKMSEVMDMQFDVIVGNPPYQLQDGGSGGSAIPLYDHFVDQAKALNPAHLAMIIPSRWMAGGRGLDAFRSSMLGDTRIRQLVDFTDASSLFPLINLNGGVCYFHWDREHQGKCEVTSVPSVGEPSTDLRDLAEHDLFVRQHQSVEILRKVQTLNEHGTFDALVSSQKPFGLRTNFAGETGRRPRSAVDLYVNGGKRWVKRTDITVNTEWIDKFKVLIPMATDGNEVYPLPVLTEPIVAEPGSACTETYLVVGPFKSKSEAVSCASYMKTRFFRFLLSLRKITQHNSRDRFSFIPQLPLNRKWDDTELYGMFDISPEERDHIAGLIREMAE